MTDKRISELDAAASAVEAHEVEVRLAGANEKATLGKIRTLLGIPLQWIKDATGAVIATVNDVTKTPLTVRGLEDQTADILRVVSQGKHAKLIDGDDTLTFVAIDVGAAGNNITIELAIAGNNTPLSYEEVGSAVTVHLATDGAGAAISTSAQIATIVNAQSTLITASFTNGAVVSAGLAGSLSGGVDAATSKFDAQAGLDVQGATNLAPVDWTNQVKIHAAPGSIANGAEIVAVYDDDGNEVFGVDGVGGFAFSSKTTPFDGRALFMLDGDPLMEVGAGIVLSQFPAGVGVSLQAGWFFALCSKIGLDLVPMLVLDSNGRLAFGMTSLVANADLAASQFSIALDDTPGATKILFKAKDSGGTVRTGNLALT